MSQPCGCCTGIQIVTPEPESNRPGLSAIAYRVGTHATFFETMLARLSTLSLDVPLPDGSGALERIYPLKNFTTRELSDPSIALLDAWATVADVLTFYQERIANEGYLGTAAERRSILELARLIGYKLRPGVSASVFLAFTVADAFNGTIPAGTRAQSIPGTNQKPQFFETSADLAARDVWNNLKPRLMRPQVITLASDPGTDALTRETLYFQGISTNLKTGDALLIVLGGDSGQQVLRFVESVSVQAQQNRTEVTLQEPPFQTQFGSQVIDNVKSAVEPFIDEAASIFAGTDTASEVSNILQDLVSSVAASDGSLEAGAQLVEAVIPQIQEKHDLAVKRGFTRLEPWTSDLLSTLTILVRDLPNLDINPVPPGGAAFSAVEPAVATSSLANLAAILEPLALPRSVQPANSLRLVRTISRTFSPQADTAPRLLAAFKPAVASTIYRAWAGVATPLSQAKVYAMRVKAAPFGNSAPLQVIVPATGSAVTFQEWTLSPNDNGFAISLDSTYDKILDGSWVAINRTDSHVKNPGQQPLIVQIDQAQSISRADYGMSARVTKLTLPENWIAGFPIPAPDKDISVLRGTTVWAQPELLDLAEEPLDTDVEGNSIELADLYDGLESGRWIIVSGERTDIPNTTGVAASELVMIAAVEQGSRAPLCTSFPANYIPFSQVFYTTDANTSGDRLVVGEMDGDAEGFRKLQQLIPVPSVPNQQFCDQVQLVPGLYANAYVPSAAERQGSFSDFAGLLVDPVTMLPYKGGVIPTSVLGKVFAWRISSAQVHTILTLANSLAYTYDSSTVTVYGNVAKATHGQTVGEVLGNGDGSQSLQKFKLGQSPLTYLAAPTPAGAESTLVVRVNEIEWHEADSLAALGPRDRDYITQTDYADKTSVIFGTGEHGARLPTGNANIKATYRYGIGEPGNVVARQISQLASQPLGLKGVINPLPATGGADRDSRDQARRNAPLAVEALDRLVSVKDYADFARTYAGIAKASSARLSDGRRLIVHVTIAGVDDIPIDQTSDLYQNLVQALEQNGDPYQPLQVAVRKLKLLVISAGVKVLPDYQWESVEPKVRAALLSSLGFDQRALCQSAFLSEVISTMQAVEGVSYVNVQKFDAVPEDITAAQLAALATTLGVKQVVEADRARVDSQATDPAMRIVPAELAILTPDIPDTLILTEITNPRELNAGAVKQGVQGRWPRVKEVPE